jgi:hypothetical protein
MLPHTLFDTLGHTFLLKPLLVAGKAMEYYGLRPGNDYDFLIPRDEFRSLRTTFPKEVITSTFGDGRIQIGDYTFYESQFGFSYFHLERDAIDRQDYLVAHPGFLLFLSTMRLIHERDHHQARVDLLLLMYQLQVLPLEPCPSSAEEESPQNVAALDATLKDVSVITVTQVTPEIQALLIQHGCTLEKQTREQICVTFPEKTQRQLLLPPTAIERYRIVLSDGLELRHEIDRAREMSLLTIGYEGKTSDQKTSQFSE